MNYKHHTKESQHHYEEMEANLSEFVRMKYGTIDELTSKGDYKKIQEFIESEDYNKFQTIQSMDGFEDENGNEFVMFFDDSKEFDNLFIYTVNTQTLEVEVLLIEEDFKKASRFFYGFKYSD